MLIQPVDAFRGCQAILCHNLCHNLCRTSPQLCLRLPRTGSRREVRKRRRNGWRTPSTPRDGAKHVATARRPHRTAPIRLGDGDRAERKVQMEVRQTYTAGRRNAPAWWDENGPRAGPGRKSALTLGRSRKGPPRQQGPRVGELHNVQASGRKHEPTFTQQLTPSRR